MRRSWIVFLLAVAVGLATTPATDAHPRDTWYWSAAFTSNFLNQHDYCNPDGSCRDVVRSNCVGHPNDPLTGRPAWRWNPQHTVKLFKHLDCVLLQSNGAIWSMLIHVKGKAQWEGTNARLIRKAGSAPPPPAPSPSNGRIYSDLGGGHWIQETSSDGAIITLEDGSLWQVAPIDRIDSMLWLIVDNITVIENGDALSGSYPYKLVNTDEGETVDAKFLGWS